MTARGVVTARLADVYGPSPSVAARYYLAATRCRSQAYLAVAVLLLTTPHGVTFAGVHWCPLDGAPCGDLDCSRPAAPRRQDLPDPAALDAVDWERMRGFAGDGDGPCSPWCGPQCEAATS